MVCIVVARNGEGDAWQFKTMLEARIHPIPQMDDVYAETAEQLLDQYGRSGALGLLRFLPPEGLETGRIRSDIENWMTSGSSATLPTATEKAIWDGVVRSAKRPPSSPDDVVRIVVEDLKSREGRVLRSRQTTREQVLPDEKPRTKEIDMGEKREVFRMDDAGVITFGKDEEGKAYGPDNSPKRGDNTKDLWSKYRSGMTVKQALDAGLTRSNIRRDRRAGYIEIENPEKAEAEADTAA